VVDSLRNRPTQVLLEQCHVMPVVDGLRVQLELLAEEVQQVRQRLDRGGNEVTLDSGDRGLGRASPIGELLLRQPVAAPGLAE